MFLFYLILLLRHQSYIIIHQKQNTHKSYFFFTILQFNPLDIEIIVKLLHEQLPILLENQSEDNQKELYCSNYYAQIK